MKIFHPLEEKKAQRSTGIQQPLPTAAGGAGSLQPLIPLSVPGGFGGRVCAFCTFPRVGFLETNGTPPPVADVGPVRAFRVPEGRAGNERRNTRGVESTPKLVYLPHLLTAQVGVQRRAPARTAARIGGAGAEVGTELGVDRAEVSQSEPRGAGGAGGERDPPLPTGWSQAGRLRLRGQTRAPRSSAGPGIGPGERLRAWDARLHPHRLPGVRQIVPGSRPGGVPDPSAVPPSPGQARCWCRGGAARVWVRRDGERGVGQAGPPRSAGGTLGGSVPPGRAGPGTSPAT